MYCLSARRCLGTSMVVLLALLITTILYLPTEAKVTITWAKQGASPEDNKVAEEIVKLFEKKHPDIKVEVVTCPTDWITQLKVWIASGAAPDIVTGYGPWWRQFIEEGCFLPLDDYISAARYSLEPFIPGQLKLWRKDGKLYSLPVYAGTVAVYVNEDLFEERGVQFPDDSWNWDRMLAAAQKLTLANADGTIRHWGTMVRWRLTDITGLPIWIRSNGGNIIPPGEVLGTRLLIDEPPALEAMRFVHSLIWKYKVAPTAAQRAGTGVPEHLLVAKGKAAMCYLGSWDSRFYAESDYKIRIVEPFPGKAGRVSFVTADAYAIVRGTNHPKEAAEFLMFLAGPEASSLRATGVGLQPARSDIVESWFKGNPLAKRGVNMGAFIKTYRYAEGVPMYIDLEAVSRTLNPILEKIFAENAMDLDASIKSTVPAINAQLAKAAKK